MAEKPGGVQCRQHDQDVSRHQIRITLHCNKPDHGSAGGAIAIDARRAGQGIA